MAAATTADVTPCPFCALTGARMEIHAHMAADHLDRVETWTDAGRGRMHYRVECPICGDDYEHRVKPRSRDRSFLESFRREIALVAFDMLLNHMQVTHTETQGGSA